MRGVIKSSRAAIDIVEAATFLAGENIEVADRFLDAVEAAFDQLAKTPGLGTPHEFENPRIGALRIWPVPGFRKFLIFYQERSDGIFVVRLLHASRDWQGLLDW